MGARPLINFLKNNDTLEEKPPEEEIKPVLDPNVAPEPIEAVETFKKEYAAKLGWTTKEVWEAAGKKPEMWRDYDQFLSTSPAYMDKLRKTNREYAQRIERVSAAAAATIEEERARIKQEAEQEAREAAAAGDADRAAAAVNRAANAGPPPETTAWMQKNTWFNEDEEARSVAVAAVNRAAKAGATISEQLQAAETSVKKRFPEYFEETVEDLPESIIRAPTPPVQEEPKKEVRMSESSRVAEAANNVAASARNRDTKNTKEKGFGDIPQGDREAYEKFFARRFQSHGLSVEAARDKYAKTYWKNQA